MPRSTFAVIGPVFFIGSDFIVSPHVAGGEEGPSKEKPASAPVVDLPEGRTISADSEVEMRIRAALGEPAELQYSTRN